MELKYKTERLDALIPADISRAAAILRRGGTVAFPTETVYGLGANALSPEAVARIFVAKQRPSWDPLIVHICDREMLDQVADLTPLGSSSGGRGELPHSFASEDERPSYAPTIRALMDAFWPGPLTLLLDRSGAIPDAVTAGRALVGVRMPAHAAALKLIREAGIPIAAPSANIFGHTSPTTAAHVLADLDGRIDAVVNGGPTNIGLESTVVGPYRDPGESFDRGLVIYRPGAVSLNMIEEVIGIGAAHHHDATGASIEPREALPSPGVGLRHYAPHARVILVEINQTQIFLEMSLVEVVDAAVDGNATATIGVMLPDGWNSSCAHTVFRWGPWHEKTILAQRLFTGLRELDDRGVTIIICPLPLPNGMGEALRDRLLKAAK